MKKISVRLRELKLGCPMSLRIIFPDVIEVYKKVEGVWDVHEFKFIEKLTEEEFINNIIEFYASEKRKAR